MRRGQASRTAMWVTWLRALGHAGHTRVRGFTDPAAAQLLDEKWKQRFTKAERRFRERPDDRRSAMVRVAVDLLALRTVVIDEAVTRELQRGTRQLVILGAGLDGRPWRLEALKDARVFEVDHPDTQAYKRERLGALQSTARQIDFVPVDFERDPLGAALAKAGHDASAPSVFVSEGVVMYLTPQAVRGMLQTVAQRSAPGSVLVLNYHTGFRRGFVALLLRLLGEPNRSAFTQDQIRAELDAAGFTVEEDEGVDAWQARHGGEAREYGAAPITRIAIARRR